MGDAGMFEGCLRCGWRRAERRLELNAEIAYHYQPCHPTIRCTPPYVEDDAICMIQNSYNFFLFLSSFQNMKVILAR